MSLYRTYRPLSLADVVGQEHVVTTLEQAAKQDKLAHAYLFAGSRGTGKTSVARILAKMLMIRGIEDEKLQKQIIRGVEDGSIVDLLEIDAASNRGIDDIRDLIEKIQFSPVAAAAKVYIIDEVHMLTKEAFNALLKTLEEPPSYAHFILATTELHKIPMTIQSRCQCFPFRRIREEDIVRRLQFIADQEHITIEREALRTIARHVEGGLRDAVSLLDQMRSLEKICVKDVEVRIGGTGREHVEPIVRALQEADEQTVLKSIRAMEEEGIPLDLFLRQLLTVVRSQLHDAVDENRPIAPLSRLLDALLGALRDVRLSPVPGLVLEAALLALCRNDAAADMETPKPLKKTEMPATQKDPVLATATRADAIVGEATPATIDGAIVEAKELTIDTLRDEWQNIVLGTTPAPVKMSLKNGRLQALDGTKVVVTFSSGFHRDTVAKDQACRAVEGVMERIFRRSLRLQCVLEDEIRREPAVVGNDSVNLAEAAAEIF